MDVGGYCIVMPVRAWHRLAKTLSQSPQSATRAALGTPVPIGQDGALQIEPPDKLTGDSVSATPGEVSSLKAESYGE